MELRPYEDADIALTGALETDPEVMRDLGGALDPSEVPALHRRRIDECGPGGDWWFVIVPEPDGPAVGTIGIWETTHQGERTHETGWLVLPAFQDRGIASRALGMLLDRAREEPRFDQILALPAVSNAASNALCRKSGFTLVDEMDHVYRGQPLRTNVWRLDLTSGPS